MTEPVLDVEALKRAPGNRDARGKFLPGNLSAVRHGLRVGAERPELAAAVAEREADIQADLGGMSELSAVRRNLIRRLAFLSVIADSLETNLAEHGTLTGKGHARAATNQYLGVVATMQRLAERVGLERVAKPTRSLQDYITEKAAQ